MSIASCAALLGAADTATFLARRPEIFRQAPGRAAGSVGFLALWVALAVTARRDQGRTPAARGLAGTLAAANAAMLAVHLRHRIASPRVFAGAALSGLALAATLRS